MKRFTKLMNSVKLGLAAVFMLSLMSSCEMRRRMYDQPKYEPLEKSTLFEDGRSSRDLVEGTVSRGNLRIDDHLNEGIVDGAQATTLPEDLKLTEEFLKRGQERFDIYCSVCHGKTGYGNGMVVQRGYKQPPSFHIDRLRDASVGYYYGVIKNGFGVMSGYADQVPVEDRWAIVAYVKTLQLSQNVAAENVKDLKSAHHE